MARGKRGSGRPRGRRGRGQSARGSDHPTTSGHTSSSTVAGSMENSVSPCGNNHSPSTVAGSVENNASPRETNPSPSPAASQTTQNVPAPSESASEAASAADARQHIMYQVRYLDLQLFVCFHDCRLPSFISFGLIKAPFRFSFIHSN